MTDTPTHTDAPPPVPRVSMAGTLFWSATGRGIALFIAVFSLLNLLAEARNVGFDANLWWIDFRPLPPWFDSIMLLCSACVLGAYAVAPRMAPMRRRVTLTVCELLGLVAAWNCLLYYYLLAHGTLYAGTFIPFSGAVLLALFIVWRGAAGEKQAGNRPRAIVLGAAAFGACAVVVPLAQMICFGSTDYRRPADVIVVFGAGVRPDGTPSDALYDRVLLGVQLYKDKLAPKLIFTGARGADEPVNEVDVMRTIAIDAGVNPKDIRLDPKGTNTTASVNETGKMLRDIADEKSAAVREEPVKVLVVSHFYHLPRIKMDYQREQLPGYPWHIYTVPVRAPLSSLPHYMLREVAAQWAYYFSALLRGE